MCSSVAPKHPPSNLTFHLRLLSPKLRDVHSFVLVRGLERKVTVTNRAVSVGLPPIPALGSLWRKDGKSSEARWMSVSPCTVHLGEDLGRGLAAPFESVYFFKVLVQYAPLLPFAPHCLFNLTALT